MGYLNKTKSGIKIHSLNNYDLLNCKNNYQKYCDEDYIKFVEILKKFGE